jgi:CDP-6-deoxy-D-xylo-4-hexulose-3-dehydrase
MSGAIGKVQLAKLPGFIRERRINADYFNGIMANKSDFIIQKEVSASSWFGFSIIVKPESGLDRQYLINELTTLGFEVRPIVAGNFTKNEVIKFADYKIHKDLKNADLVHDNGLFIGNHHYDIKDGLKKLEKL